MTLTAARVRGVAIARRDRKQAMADDPYKGPQSDFPRVTLRLVWRHVLTVLISGASVYYAVSACTLPFADSVWMGEIPLLAIPQLPKSLVHEYAQDFLMWLLRITGFSSGSPSPDMITTHSYAMLAITTLPLTLLIGLATLTRSLRSVRRPFLLLVLLAGIDAGVSVWFDQTSNLSLY